MSVSEQLRRVIRESGITHYRIGKDTGLVIRTIDRFVTEGTPTHTDTFDALSDYFGLELHLKPGTVPRRFGKKTGTGHKQAGKKPATKRKQRKKSAE